MNPLISLVIPVYNVEKYLPRCMETVFAQTYDNFEIILVDDGSTDSSGKMCDEYAAKDDRVRVFHKENGGLSDARNFGVQKARGDLVSFIDSDDCVTEDYLQYLYDLKEKYGADMACADSIVVKEGKTPKVSIIKPEEKKLNTEESLRRICHTSVSACHKLYKKDILLEHPYPKGRLYEDTAVTCRIVASSDNTAFSNKIIYYYFIREGTISHNIISEKQYDLFWASNEQLQYISREFPAVRRASECRCIHDAMWFLDNLFSYHSENEKIHFQRARKFAKPYLLSGLVDKQATINMRISSIAIWMGYLPSKIFWKTKFLVKRIKR